MAKRGLFVAQLQATLEKYGLWNTRPLWRQPPPILLPCNSFAPYSTCLGEYYAQNGQDALIIYDDLSKHAWAYREISLLLRRPSGREAYPGDVFYLHSRLLERSCRLNKGLWWWITDRAPHHRDSSRRRLGLYSYQTSSVLPMVRFIPETDLFNSGFKPAINSGLSVSRGGGDAQIKVMKKSLVVCVSTSLSIVSLPLSPNLPLI